MPTYPDFSFFLHWCARVDDFFLISGNILFFSSLSVPHMELSLVSKEFYLLDVHTSYECYDRYEYNVIHSVNDRLLYDQGVLCRVLTLC